jgi:putative tricarboxylic transport membrane protein
VYKLCALLLFFVLLLYYVNFIAATLVFVPACMWLLGRRDLPVMAAVSIGLPLAIYFIFTRLLRITLP